MQGGPLLMATQPSCGEHRALVVPWGALVPSLAAWLQAVALLGALTEPSPKKKRRVQSMTPDARGIQPAESQQIGVVEATAGPESVGGQQAEGVTKAPPVRSVWALTEEEVDAVVATSRAVAYP